MKGEPIPPAKQAEIELKHIQLELVHGRTNHMRHFVDQYYCFKNVYLNRNGGARWEAVVWGGVVSTAARALANRKQVVKEHVVPLRVITSELVAAKEAGHTSLSAIAEILDRLTHFGTITKEEDKRLRDAGLNQAMPHGFFEQGHSNYGDILSRYREVGIEIECSL
ncbi:MAG: hypothetical protein AUJ57_04390 [Zetaproteobacteria bacterium CG1_02_53_45]|nr:MAG: hypothetical protein AUJ57_04390 [Zetaproteobacteria bacterium CG1_02_53_45]